MSTLGKVLTFLNVLVAILLLVLAGMNYGEARFARASAFRHELAVTGLPVDEQELSQYYPDDPIADRLTPPMLTDIFSSASGGADLGGGPVKTVMEEIDRVQRKVKENVQSQSNEAQQRAKLAGYLLMQARDIKEREDLQNKLRTAPINDLLNDLDRRFAQVKATYSVRASAAAEKEANKRTVMQQSTALPPYKGLRDAAAELFVNLSADEAWWERVRVVLGFDALVHGLDHASLNMQQLTAGVRQGIIRDQGAFVSAYQELTQELTYHAENLYQADKRLAELQGVTKERDLEVKQRQTEVERNRAELAELTASKNAEVAKLEAIQRDLFALQQRLGSALEATRNLEQQIRQRSGGR